jgi:hypothetical protein
MAPETTHDDLCVLPESETRRLTGLSKFTLLRMRKLPDAGGLPFIRISAGRIGYLKRDLDAYLLARRVGSLPKPAEAA